MMTLVVRAVDADGAPAVIGPGSGITAPDTTLEQAEDTLWQQHGRVSSLPRRVSTSSSRKGLPEHQPLRAVGYLNQMPGRADVSRPPGAGAHGQGAQRPKLAPYDGVVPGSSTTRSSVQHHGVDLADHTADTGVRRDALQHGKASHIRPWALGAPNLTNRSMAGTFPFWPGSDRIMGEEVCASASRRQFFVYGQSARPALLLQGLGQRPTLASSA